MKLYNEEQVNHILDLARKSGVHIAKISIDVDKKLTPIELPSDKNIWEWWQTQKFQKEQDEQEYTMLYEIDLPKILKSFIEHLIQGGNK